MPAVSVAIITLNEDAHIDACLESVAWADDIVVVDAGSTDGTVERAQQRGARVVVRDWHGFAAQKNAAAALARHDWVLSIDADERVTPGLAAEIRHVLAREPDVRGFRIPRVAWYLGRWLRSTDWYPDPQLRLYDRRAGGWRERLVHESVQVDGPVGRLTGEIQHFPYRDVAHHLETINRYTTLAARQMRDEGRRATIGGILWHPPLAFLRNYVLRGGFRDGAPGLVVSMLNAAYVMTKLVKLWELDRPRPDDTAR